MDGIIRAIRWWGWLWVRVGAVIGICDPPRPDELDEREFFHWLERPVSFPPLRPLLPPEQS